ncbi:MAG: hypothetical protein EOP11_18110 [Proteobacteria bacterium]|nr:MAG: hypothetical protein EOP11_18110 [Pseudomonadota bacterium]
MRPSGPPKEEWQSRCDPEDGKLSAADSPQLAYFESLLARGTKAPLENFLRPWFPDAPQIGSESTFFSCEAHEEGPLKISPDGTVPEKCRPDTLYSWGPYAKLEAVAERLSDSTEWKDSANSRGMARGALFTSISPISTFGYGPVLLRFKLKPGTSMVKTDFEGKQGQVGVRTDAFHDLVIADASVIESWSSGTPEIYDEVVRDILRYKNKQRRTVYRERDLHERGAPSEAAWREKKGIADLYQQATDQNIQDEEGLKLNLLELIRQILANEGGVSFVKGACTNRAQHFATRMPSYFNPYELKAPVRP